MDKNTLTLPLERSPETWAAIEDHLDPLDSLDNEALTAEYNAVFLNTSGHPLNDRAARLFALRQVFLDRFNRSPIELVGDELISCQGPIIHDPAEGFVADQLNHAKMRQDQRMLSRFMKGTNGKNGFDDLDDDVQRWWMNRY